MSDTISPQIPLKWGDSFDLLSDDRKQELRARLDTWIPEQATEKHPGPFANERLSGLDVFWLVACTLTKLETGSDPAAAAQILADKARRITVSLSTLNLVGANLREAHLNGAYLSGVRLNGGRLDAARLNGACLNATHLNGAHLNTVELNAAHLVGAHLNRARLAGAQLFGADLSEAHLFDARLNGARLSKAHLTRADLRKSDLGKADMSHADLTGASLREADLVGADLSGARLIEADLHGARLSGARIVDTDLTSANLSSCSVYGTSVWNVKLDSALPTNIRITPMSEPKITADNLEVAQFIYLMLHNDKIRQVIDTITGKLVLILGRFTEERKPILDALRDELRRRNYLPVVFDFDKPASRDLTETISTLAHMARFVIADLTDAKSIPQELSIIIPNLPSVAIQPLIHVDDTEYAMVEHWRSYPWVLATYRYESLNSLLNRLKENVIDPAEQRANEIAPLKH